MATPRIYKSQYLTIEATSSGNVTITLKSNLTSTDLASFSYSKDHTNWTTWTNDQQGITITVAMDSGDKLYLKGSGQRYHHTNEYNDTIISMTCDAKVYGNIMSLLYGDDFVNADTVYTFSFQSLFRDQTHITEAGNLVLPATEILGRTYGHMFYGCTSLTTAPELPATTLGFQCYISMFQGCTSLTTAPTLPAATLTNYCYNKMFSGCTSLNKIKMYATNISATNCLSNWVNNVASTGTFTKYYTMESLPTGTSGIPSGWTVKNYNPNTYSGTVYDMGDTIPGYVSFTYKPKIWYDKSKSTNGGTWDIFSELGISESLILGDTEDDLWNYEEILEEICKYFNLHIIQIGYDFYIFDWETAKSGNSVEWVDILTGNTQQKSYSTITVTKSMYSDDSTQITMGDVYNQIVLEDKVEKFDDVIVSPFDKDSLENVCGKQHYMNELYATGQGNAARDAFIALLNGGVGTTYNEDKDSAYTREWWFLVKKSKYWKYMLNGTDNYSVIPKDANDNYYRQWMLAKYVDSTPFASGIFSFGHGEKTNNKNNQNKQNITSFTDYIVINVAGNGYDENSPTSETIYDPTTGMPIGTQPTHIFPSDNDIQNSGMKIEYINATDGVYSSADSSIMNYLVFTGKIHLTTAHERTGSEGFAGYENDSYNYWTSETNKGNSEFHYVDNTVFKRKSNTYANIKNMVNNGLYIKGRCVGSNDNDKGRYYTNLFYNQDYPNYSDAPNPSENFLAPPCAEGDISKRFKYDLVDNRSYYGTEQTGWDTVPFIDILACTLQIGDKYCMETVQNGKKHFEWVTEEELKNMGEDGYTTLADGSTLYKAFVYLAVNIDDGQYLIGESHDIYNNIDTTMGLNKTGMAIPMPHSAHLSGNLKFAIVGPVNTVWKDGIYRHPTWFRHTNWTHNAISILPHVDKIYIEAFDFEPVSDHGKINTNGDNDIIYMSDEQKTYINKKDDIEFKFNTALTAEEAYKMGVEPVIARSTVVNITTGDPILNIVNNVTSETDKPEKHYVDAYYREYNQPRMIVDTSFVETDQVMNFNKYEFPYIDNKMFYVVKTEKDVKREKINLTLKERNS